MYKHDRQSGSEIERGANQHQAAATNQFVDGGEHGALVYCHCERKNEKQKPNQFGDKKRQWRHGGLLQARSCTIFLRRLKGGIVLR
jgi:hypothetical protein